MKSLLVSQLSDTEKEEVCMRLCVRVCMRVQMCEESRRRERERVCEMDENGREVLEDFPSWKYFFFSHFYLFSQPFLMTV